MKKRMLFGVIGAEVNSIAQREIIKGIAERAQVQNIDVAVISNIYNLDCWDGTVPHENQIYELILSREFDGLIVLSEPFRCDSPRAKVCEYLRTQNEIPIVVAGAALPDFELSNATLINTNDTNDMEAIAEHLIIDHGFADIDFLTGPVQFPISHQRLHGYKKALEKHGIVFDRQKVIYGDFWMDSGQKLAQEYISGQRPCPEAVMCANDYMAYGLLDEFAEQGIDIQNCFAVVGYDYAWNRYEHVPLLTTYQRNREQLGRDAVDILLHQLNGTECSVFQPPRGSFRVGTSCFCRCPEMMRNEELKAVRLHSTYEQWNLLSQMNQQLTECHTLKEFIGRLGSFQYLVRHVQNMFICLFDGWHEREAAMQQRSLTCCSIVSEEDKTPFKIQQYQIGDIIQKSSEAAVYYFSPLHFKERLFGYVVLKYDTPDVYDDIYRNWLTSVSDGLEFLRMKHDIHYLMQCQSMTENYDSLTSFRNDTGMQKTYGLLKYTEHTGGTVFSVMLRTCLFHDDFYETHKVQSLLDITEAILQFTHHKCDMCGRIDYTTFLCFLKADAEFEKMLVDNLNAIITQHKVYIANYGMDSFVYSILPFDSSISYHAMKQKHFSVLAQQMEAIRQRQTLAHYEQMLKIRSCVYLNSHKPPSTDEMCKSHTISPGHLRVVYKQCFGISFHQDCINSRISFAKYLLYTTNIPVASVADQCGYEDNRYFLRQFQNCTGMTPKQYRAAVSRYLNHEMEIQDL